jgi:hypothetical protein
MGLSNKAQNRIMQLIKDYKDLMTFKTVGPGGLSRSRLRELILSGKIKKDAMLASPVIEAYLKTHQQAVDSTAAPMDVRRGAISFLERQMQRYSEKAVTNLTTDILGTLEAQIHPEFDQKEGSAIYEALQDPKLFKKNLRSLLNDKVDMWEHRWKTVVTTELARASNFGAMDAIIHNNKGADSAQITVFKSGNKPHGGSCEVCAKLWYLPDGITPKTYRLSELMANGSNHGKKKPEWLATIDNTHPNESHTLHELKSGYGFSGGDIAWVGVDHDEFEKQSTKP